MNELVIWLITPPNNMRSFVNAVAERWNGKVTLIVCYDIRKERKETGFDDTCEAIKHFYILDKMSNGRSFARKYMREHINSIYVFGGIFKCPAQYMRYLIRVSKGKAKVFAISEKPHILSDTGIKSKIKNVIGKLVYTILIKKTMNSITSLFAISDYGKKYFQNHGWVKKSIYNFMYCDGDSNISNNNCTVSKPVKFIHVGRINYRHHGYDQIILALNRITDIKYEFTIVGDYGEDRDEVLKWAKSKSNVKVINRWSSNEVTKRLSDYDVYICAAKEDSWHGQINSSIFAGVGVITTNRAGSDELVKASNTGIVINSNDSEQLESAIRFCINNPDIVSKWKSNTKMFANRISPQTVADYFCRVIEYEIGANEDSPKCPWLED